MTNRLQRIMTKVNEDINDEIIRFLDDCEIKILLELGYKTTEIENGLFRIEKI